MTNTETIKPFSSIGEPGKFDRDKAIIYRDGLTKLFLKMNPSYKRDLFKIELDQINDSISYYDENKIAYSL